MEVTGEGTGIQTEDANLETYINAQPLAVLPNPGNDLSAVALTAPGAVMNTTGGSVFGGGNYEFFGLPSNSNVLTYDGANDNDPYFNIESLTAVILHLETTRQNLIDLIAKEVGSEKAKQKTKEALATDSSARDLPDHPSKSKAAS
jgi:hypothetical protein